jgi:hypothetical protein
VDCGKMSQRRKNPRECGSCGDGGGVFLHGKPYPHLSLPTLFSVPTVGSQSHDGQFSAAAVSPLSHKTSGYCWPTQKCRNGCLQHAFLEGKKAGETCIRRSTARTLKPGRLRARSCRPFLPAPHRTGLDTCRIIRLSGFLVSLTLAYWNGCRHDIVCRAECSCVFGIS